MGYDLFITRKNDWSEAQVQGGDGEYYKEKLPIKVIRKPVKPWWEFWS